MNKNDNQTQDSKLVVYELAVLLDPKLSEDQVDSKTTALGDIVSQGSGAVLSTGQPRLRNLAYEMTIKKEGKRRDFTRAHFNWLKFEQEPDALVTIENTLKGDDTIIRFLIIKTTREDTVTDLTDEIDLEGEDAEDEDAQKSANDSKDPDEGQDASE